MKLGDTLKIKGIYGDFVLRTTPNPKVFVATGTGLSPIIHMLTAGPLQSKENQLFF
ncbi:MAG: hypothetical protein H6767_02220 [Candidatus Peribacteria bacterium]|nr:MAG: hypothetical protein H6767_02220 [Candidatus Peribacteria bacterium]